MRIDVVLVLAVWKSSNAVFPAFVLARFMACDS